MEGDYSFIYDPEILSHWPGPILFLYREGRDVTQWTGGDQQPTGKELIY